MCSRASSVFVQHLQPFTTALQTCCCRACKVYSLFSLVTAGTENLLFSGVLAAFHCFSQGGCCLVLWVDTRVMSFCCAIALVCLLFALFAMLQFDAADSTGTVICALLPVYIVLQEQQLDQARLEKDKSKCSQCCVIM